MEIVYRSNRSDYCRCNLYMLAHGTRDLRNMLGFYVFGVVLAHFSWHLAFPMAFIGGLGWLAFIFALTLIAFNQQVNRRYPASNPNPKYSVHLTPEGIYCNTNERHLFIA